MINVLVPVRNERRSHPRTGQQLVIQCRIRPPSPGELIKMPQFHEQDCGLHGIEPEVAPHAIVVILPSEHRVDHDARFMKYVADAASAASARTDLPFVIGARPRTADPSCPWIEPGPPIEGLEFLSVRSVKRFLPRPSVAEVDSLFMGQGLLNTHVLVAHARTLIDLGKRYMPDVLESLEPLEEVAEGPEADLLCDAVYECMPQASLAHGLTDGWRHFAVLPIPDAMWGERSRPGLEALAS